MPTEQQQQVAWAWRGQHTCRGEMHLNVTTVLLWAEGQMGLSLRLRGSELTVQRSQRMTDHHTTEL